MITPEVIRTSIAENNGLRRWISRAFIISILVYFVVIGYLVAEAVMGASKWAPYGVNIPVFIALVISCEIAMAVTGALIFKEDSGIWPASIAEGWAKLRDGAIRDGAQTLLAGAWDTSIIDLRLRTPYAIFLGRLNRITALVPLVYALAASAGGAPWGLRSSALVDVGITLAVWAFMELVMVQPETRAPAAARAVDRSAADAVVIPAEYARTSRATGELTYQVRPVEFGDLDRLERLERIMWKDHAATRDMILSRLDAYPQGQLAAVHVRVVDGAPVRRSVEAWCTAMPATESRVRAFTSWDDVTSNGTIRDCTTDGNVIVGVNLTSVAEGASYFLIGEVLATLVQDGKRKLICGSRLNGFATFNSRRQKEGNQPFSADQYARLREIRGYQLNEDRTDAGLDPLSDADYLGRVATLRAASGEAPLPDDEAPDYVCSNLRGYLSIPDAYMVEVIPDYFSDPASNNFGVLLEWQNPIPRPLRYVPWIKRWAAARIRNEVQQEWLRRTQRLRERQQRRAAERVPEFLRKEPPSEAPAPEATPTTSDRSRVRRL
ncbi:MAG: hypothetical protein WBD55_03580 [Dehalococcoidia bacterium]